MSSIRSLAIQHAPLRFAALPAGSTHSAVRPQQDSFSFRPRFAGEKQPVTPHIPKLDVKSFAPWLTADQVRTLEKNEQHWYKTVYETPEFDALAKKIADEGVPVFVHGKGLMAPAGLNFVKFKLFQKMAAMTVWEGTHKPYLEMHPNVQKALIPAIGSSAGQLNTYRVDGRPLIIIAPNYADDTAVLAHEYSHALFRQDLPELINSPAKIKKTAEPIYMELRGAAMTGTLLLKQLQDKLPPEEQATLTDEEKANPQKVVEASRKIVAKIDSPEILNYIGNRCLNELIAYKRAQFFAADHHYAETDPDRKKELFKMFLHQKGGAMDYELMLVLIQQRLKELEDKS